MKSLYSVVAILTALTIIGMVAIGSQQIYAPRDCGACTEFIKRTNEFVSDFSRVVPHDSIGPLVKLTNTFKKDVLHDLSAGQFDPRAIDIFSDQWLSEPNDDGKELLIIYRHDLHVLLG